MHGAHGASLVVVTNVKSVHEAERCTMYIGPIMENLSAGEEIIADSRETNCFCAASPHSRWWCAPLKLFCEQPIKIKKKNNKQMQLCRAAQCRQEPHMSSLVWTISLQDDMREKFHHSWNIK